MLKKISLLILLMIGLVTGLFARDPQISDFDWPQFRGPDRNGIYPQDDFSAAKLSSQAVLWKKNIGRGYSAPSVFQDKLFILGHEEPFDIVRCLNAKNGNQIWEFKYRTTKGRDYPGSRSSPTYDEGKVYTLGRSGNLFCLDASNGKKIWSQDITKLGAQNLKWNFAGSVLISGDLAIINAAESGIAFDKNTGKIKWISSPGLASYATPVKFTFKGTDYLAIFSGSNLYAVELKTGKKLWSTEWINRWNVNASDPLIFDNKVFISTGYGKGCALYDFSSGSPKQLWANKAINSHFHSSIYYKNMIFGPNGDAGNSRTSAFRCVNPKNGQVVWEERLGYAGFILADDKFILCNESGEVIIFKASTSSFNEISSAFFDAGQYWTAPVLSRGLLYIRSNEGLLTCIDLR